MRTPIRKTIAGTEYWDTVEKRTILIPHGETPDFEVVENPKSLIEKKTVKVIEEEVIDETERNDFNEQEESLVVSPKNQEENIDELLALEDEEPEGVDISSMSIKELKAHAKENKIEIPKKVTRRDDILEFISDYEMEKALLEE